MSFFDSFGPSISALIEKSAQAALAPLPFYLRKISLGFVLTCLSVVSFSLTLVALAASLFLGFSHLPFVGACLATGGIFLLLGLFSIWIGFSLLRAPRTTF